MKVKRKKRISDRVMVDGYSPILDDDMLNQDAPPMAVSGQINIGKNGNPVTVVLEDEVTGEILEINHVQSALLVIEDKRKTSNGWLSIAVGNLDRLGEVLSFIAKTTIYGLKKLMKVEA